MADGLFIKLTGFDELIAALKRAPAKLTEDVAYKLEKGAKATQEEMKILAPRKYSFLVNKIDVLPATNNGLTIGIRSGANYSAYVEFGTGTKVDVPEGVEEYALQFKGVHEVPGMYPRPYFFPAIFNQIPIIVADMKKTLDKMLERA